MNDARVIMDPGDESVPAERALSPRLADIAGKTIGLLDISKARGDVFLNRLQEQVEGRGAKVLRFVKPTFARPAPVDLRQEIATKCDAVIEALAD